MDYPHSDLTGRIIKCAHALYNHLGTGFRESVYQAGLGVEMHLSGIRWEIEVPIPLVYRGWDIGDYRADFVVEDLVVVELKAVETLLPAHSAQLLNYLRFSGKQLGLLVNFGWHRIEVKRRILSPPAASVSA